MKIDDFIVVPPFNGMKTLLEEMADVVTAQPAEWGRRFQSATHPRALSCEIERWLRPAKNVRRRCRKEI
jgi:hypothetical protein